MKYISEESIVNAWSNLIKLGVQERLLLNKFFGILELLSHIDLAPAELIIPNQQYMVGMANLSTTLQEKYYFSETDRKNFSSSEFFSLVFPKNWDENLSHIALRQRKLSLQDVIAVQYQSRSFDDNITTPDIIKNFEAEYHLANSMSIFFEDGNFTFDFQDSKPNRGAIFDKVLVNTNITKEDKFTLGFDKSLISANPGELSRGPFIQPLYSAQENLKYIFIANFDISQFYNITFRNNKEGATGGDLLQDDFSGKLSSISGKNIIFFGAPGTGKSYAVDKIVANIDDKFVERVTFHPDYDYASFVGSYKPTQSGDSEDSTAITYDFVPQTFTNIYSKAWEDLENNYYLVIEEINRGNCAEIFGEVFQLLDRGSNYSVSPSVELRKHLLKKFCDNADHPGIKKGLRLPPNLNIYATMNTSDQSLFPMDSAFKRRWEWMYIPICYDQITEEGKPNTSFNYEIKIEDGLSYRWIDFIKKINLDHIKPEQNLGADKCIGNYFIKPDEGNTITLKPFINKVIFYLWNDVFKDEQNKVFEDNTSYEDFFPINTAGKQKVKEMFTRIGLQPISDSDSANADATDDEQTENTLE